MKILITGAAGFIGTNLIALLLKENHKKIAIDNLYTGSIKNIERLGKDIKFIEHDVINPIKIDCDFIINLACPASPRHYQKDPIYTSKVCFQGTLNLLELARSMKIPMLHASTSEIYGDPQLSPQHENYWGNVNPIGIRSCYDEGKRIAETLCYDYIRQYQCDLKVIRIFNTYGPYMDVNDGRVVSNFIVSALKNEDITIYGDGNQTRSFCFVSDLVSGIYKFVLNCNHKGAPINLGNPNEMKINDLANKIRQLTKSKSRLVYYDLPKDDPTKRKPDISSAFKNLDWVPKVNLEEGLIKTIDYFKEELFK